MWQRRNGGDDTHNDEYFEELLMEAEYLKMDTETQAQYERRIMIMRDNKNADDYARKVATAEGLAEGRVEGRAEGMAEGISLTLKARTMLKENVSVQDICKETGLPEDVVLALK